MLIAITGGINNIGDGEVFIEINKLFALGVGKDWLVMIGTMLLPSDSPRGGLLV